MRLYSLSRPYNNHRRLSTALPPPCRLSRSCRRCIEGPWLSDYDSLLSVFCQRCHSTVPAVLYTLGDAHHLDAKILDPQERVAELEDALTRQRNASMLSAPSDRDSRVSSPKGSAVDTRVFIHLESSSGSDNDNTLDPRSR